VPVRVSERGDPRRHRPRQLAVPELVYILH
jgi:hypothetical protein